MQSLNDFSMLPVLTLKKNHLIIRQFFKQNIMRNKTRIYCIPLFWEIKGIEIWNAQNDRYISNKIKVSGLTKVLKKLENKGLIIFFN